jgi:succinoglycan biosynthesis protein ExoA
MGKNLKFSLAIPVAPDRDCPILEFIKNLDYPKKDYEVLIEKGKNPSENRNKCAKRAKHDLIYFLDDDAELPKNFLKRANEFFQKFPEYGAVGGPQLTPKSDGIFARLSGYILESRFACFKMSQRYQLGKLNLNASELSLTSANCCIRKKVINKVGGFNPDLFPGEDPEMFDRIKNAGYKIAFNPDLIIYHKRRANLKSFIKQFYLYGNTRLKKENELKQNPGLVFIIPSLFSVYLVLLPFLLYWHRIFIYPLELYFVIAFVFSLFIAIKKRSFLGLFALFFLHFIVHISYGIGMIVYFFESKKSL